MSPILPPETAKLYELSKTEPIGDVVQVPNVGEVSVSEITPYIAERILAVGQTWLVKKELT